jgi:hypothetical protein
MKRLAVVLATITGGVLALWNFSPAIAGMVGFCSNAVKVEAWSPSREQRAVVFTRSCGATTEYATSISVRPSWQPGPYGPGNVFFAVWNENAGKKNAGNHGPPVQVFWQDESSLVVTYDSRAMVDYKRSRVGRVAVYYRQRVFHGNP